MKEGVSEVECYPQLLIKAILGYMTFWLKKKRKEKKIHVEPNKVTHDCQPTQLS